MSYREAMWLTILCNLLCDTTASNLENDLSHGSSTRPIFEGTFSFAHTSLVALQYEMAVSSAEQTFRTNSIGKD